MTNERRVNNSSDWRTVSSYITDKIARGGIPAIRGSQINALTAEWLAKQLDLSYSYNLERDLYEFYEHR